MCPNRPIRLRGGLLPELPPVQILETVPPEALFCDDYPYPLFSDALLDHSRKNVLDLITRQNLDAKSFVLELASNDGYLLKNYVQAGIPCLGIDPAEGPAKAAEQAGVPTLLGFFTEDLALRLQQEGRTADVLHANNVLAHVKDTNGFVRGIKTVLKENGVAVIEVPYLKELIEHCEFDTIYHEHLCYFSVTSLNNLFRRHGLYLNHVKPLPIHGGSLRLYVGRREDISDLAHSMLADEAALGMDMFAYYRDSAG